MTFRRLLIAASFLVSIVAMAAGQNSFEFRKSSDNTFTTVITDAGRVGIGTTTPGAKLQVTPATNADGILIVADGVAPAVALGTHTLSGSRVEFGQAAVAQQFSMSSNIGDGIIRAGVAVPSNFMIQSGSGTAALYVQKVTNNVGVGTASPTTKLQSISTADGNFASFFGDSGGFYLQSSATDPKANLYSYDFPSTPVSMNLSATAGNQLFLATSGHVGLGTINPTAPNSGQRVFVSSGTTAEISVVATSNGGHNLFAWEGVYGNAKQQYYAGSGILVANGSWELYDKTQNANRIVVSTNGNVGVGTNSPSAGATGIARVIDVSGSNGGQITLTDTGNAKSAAVYSNVGDLYMQTLSAGTSAYIYTGNGNVKFPADQLPMNKALCLNASGYLKTCTSVVDASGGCTCP